MATLGIHVSQYRREGFFIAFSASLLLSTKEAIFSKFVLGLLVLVMVMLQEHCLFQIAS